MILGGGQDDFQTRPARFAVGGRDRPTVLVHDALSDG
jgi:hypothetical protein